MSRRDHSYEQPSRLSRVAVVLSALAVGFLAVWVLTPIVLANLAATSAAVTQPRELASAPRKAASAPREAANAPREAKDLTIAAQPAVSVSPAQPESAPERIAAVAPEPPPLPAFAAESPSALGISAEPAAPASANSIPWPVLPAGVEPAAAAVPDALASTPPESFGPVPLPRRRPNAAQTARLVGIPLPRPRPEAAGADVPASDQSGMDTLIDRTRYE